MKKIALIGLLLLTGCAFHPYFPEAKPWGPMDIIRKDRAIKIVKVDNETSYVIGYGTHFKVITPDGIEVDTRDSGEKWEILDKGMEVIQTGLGIVKSTVPSPGL